MHRLLFALSLFLLPMPASADNSHCLDSAPTRADLSDLSPNADTGLAGDQVRLQFISGSTYLIETAKGTTAATDFTGAVGDGLIPDVVTMNSALASYFMVPSDPRISHVFLDSVEGEPVCHEMSFGQMFVRNLPHNLRGGYGTIEDDNSIFIFEVWGLCIGHIGQLHREPSADEYAAMGTLDVVMVPVEGGRTLDTLSTIRLLKRLHAELVLPMDWSDPAALETFLVGLADSFEIDRRAESISIVSRRELPTLPVVRVLMPSAMQAALE